MYKLPFTQLPIVPSRCPDSHVTAKMLDDVYTYYEEHKHCDPVSMYKKVLIRTGRGRNRKKRETWVPVDYAHKALHHRIARALVSQHHPAVTSYEKGKSRKDAAKVHEQSYQIFGMDIKDYFPSITMSMVAELYRMYVQQLVDLHYFNKTLRRTPLEYGQAIAFLSTLPHPTRTDVGENVLILGISNAPGIANMILYSLDCVIHDKCSVMQLRYSRYCDNLYVSSEDRVIDRATSEELVALVQDYTAQRESGPYKPFAVHPGKLRRYPGNRRQRILGVVVNDHATLSRTKVDKTRYWLWRLHTDAQTLVANMRAQRCSTLEAQIEYLRLERLKRTVFGYTSELASIDRDKYERKCMSKRTAINALMRELSRSIFSYIGAESYKTIEKRAGQAFGVASGGQTC